MQHATVDHGRRMRAGIARPSAIDSDASHRLVAMLALALAASALAAWYGFLDSAGSHPALKLGGAMVIAGVGTASLSLGRPFAPHEAVPRVTAHSALVEVHPLTLAAAWASMGVSLIHFAVIKQHFDDYYLYGWFFVAVGLAQLVWAALAVATRSRLLLIAGAVGNAAVAAVWLVTRTYGS